MVVAAGYMGGFPDEMFHPTKAVTRAEAAQALVAALKDRQEISEPATVRRRISSMSRRDYDPAEQLNHQELVRILRGII